MIFIKNIFVKLYKILSKVGYVVMQLTIMTVIAFFLLSVRLVSEESKNPYCRVANQNIELVLEYDSIDYYTYRINCNTLECEIFLNDNITKEKCISLLIEIKTQLELQSLDIATHFIIFGSLLEDVMYANLNLGYEGISYIGG